MPPAPRRGGGIGLAALLAAGLLLAGCGSGSDPQPGTQGRQAVTAASGAARESARPEAGDTAPPSPAATRSGETAKQRGGFDAEKIIAKARRKGYVIRQNGMLGSLGRAAGSPAPAHGPVARLLRQLSEVNRGGRDVPVPGPIERILRHLQEGRP